VFAFFIRLGAHPLDARLLSGFIFIIFFLSIFFLFFHETNKRQIAPLYFYLILAVASFNNVFSWQHHLVFAYPLIVYWYYRVKDRMSHLFTFLLFGAIEILLVFHFPSPSLIPFQNPFLASYQTIALFLFCFYILADRLQTQIKLFSGHK
jgi:hypothetical protein